MTLVLDALRLLGGLLWAVPLIVLGPSVCRVIRHQPERYDEIRSLLFFVAANNFGFSIRHAPDPVAAEALRTIARSVAARTGPCR